jgi:hypothetical protein
MLALFASYVLCRYERCYVRSHRWAVSHKKGIGSQFVTDRSLRQKWNTRNEWWQIAQLQVMSNIYHEASRSGLPRGFGTRVKHGGSPQHSRR